MIHVLKIYKQYADEVANGNKMFEVRKNDRNYQKDDLIQFEVEGVNGFHELDKNMYKITYVLNEFHALERGYVVLGIKKIDNLKCGCEKDTN